MLGHALGTVLQEQAGPALFQTVEEIRRAAINQRRRATPPLPGSRAISHPATSGGNS
jgi:hypothetical protein